ncbi:MAG: 5'-nucleotidase C-terminal domain-containing protein [Eubacterium sp.]|nr:5'-nucleotidase C-terminal domain-containing protein [Eubacterium sp.]
MKNKKMWKRIAALGLTCAMALSGIPFGTSAVSAADYDEVVAIVHTNDVHGHIDIEPYVKGLADSLKDSGDYSLVLTVSAGDVYGGGEAVAGYYKGELIPEIQDKVYDILVPGNNDFGTGGVNCVSHNLLLTALYENTKTLCANTVALDAGIDAASYAESYTSKVGNSDFASRYSNVSLNSDGTLDFSALDLPSVAAGENPYEATTTYTTDNGTKIGLFGVTTNGGALEVQVECTGSINGAQTSIDALEDEGATVIVGVGHTGWMGEGSEETSSNDTNSWQLANSVTGMDAFIDSHTHSIINDGAGCYVGDEEVFVNQAQCFGGCIGVMYLYIKDGEVVEKKGEVITDMSGITPDAEVLSLVEADLALTEEELGTALSKTSYFLNGERLSSENNGGSVRGNETNLGDLMTDILRKVATEETGEDYAFIMYPGFWLRASIEAGYITKQDIVSVFANPTMIGFKTYTAEDILENVETGLTNVYPEKEGTTFFQVSGLTITYENNEGVGTPITIKVGDTLIYDADNGGIVVDDDWSVTGLYTFTGAEIDSYTGDYSEVIFRSEDAIQDAVCEYLSTHISGEDYYVYSNVIAPDRRITEVNTEYETATIDSPTLKTNKISIKTTSKTVKYSKVKSAKQKFSLGITTRTNYSVKKLYGSKYLTVTKKGVVTVKKGTPKGTYRIKVKIAAGKSSLYKNKIITKKITVTVK